MSSLRFAICLFVLAQSVFAGTQVTLYVSPNGGGNNFSLAQPGNLFDARDYVRTINTNMTGDIVVYLRGGTYQLTNSFQLQENSTTHDSGNSGYNIIYENYPGETPIISGGMLVTNWSLFSASSNIWRTFVGTGINSRQLYVNDVRAIRARSALNPSGFVTNSASTGFNTTNTAMQFWENQTNIEIVQRHNWKQLRCPIQSITGTNIVMQTPGWTYTGKTPTPGRPWNGNGTVSLTGVTWVENAYELLDSAGMWYLNQATGYLYYIPRPGENLTNGAVVVLPVVGKLIDAQGGDVTTPIHNVIFSGINFEYATWLLPGTSAGYADNQTTIMWSGPTNALKTSGNVSFQTAANIQITNCIFEHLGGSAIDFGGGAHNNLIIGNHIEDISADGISVGEVTDYATTDTNQMTDGNMIEDNFIRRPGQDYEDAIGIYFGYSRNTVIAHNDIDNTPYSGICLGWGWGTPTYSENNRVLGNYVGKVMQTLTDGGSCYTLSAQTNSWEIANYYKDSCYQGIYWDEGTSYYTGISNVFDNIARNYVNLHSSGGTVPLNDQFDIATNNFANVTAHSTFSTAGTNCVLTNTVAVSGQFWPPAAQQIILQAGIEPAFTQIKSAEILVNDTEPNFDLVPSDWTYAPNRTLGDYHGDLHYTQINGQAVQYTFTAASIAWLGEMNTDESNVDVYLDGSFQQTVNCYSATRIAQARLFSVTNLSVGPHTLKLVKDNGTYMMFDAFAVTPNNFWLTATTNDATVNAGNTFSNVVKLDTFNNFSGTTTLSVDGLPSGANANFSSSTLNGAGFSAMTITTMSNTPAGNYELTISGVGGGVTNIATVGLVVFGSANLRWNSTSSTAWDLTTSNWFNLGSGAADIFRTGDNVFFDDTAGVTPNVTISGGVTVQPNTVTISSSANNFTISGAGAIGGSANLVKSGASILNLNTTNSFTGGVMISGGILRAGTASALGSTSGTTIITNGGTLDVNGFNLTAEPIVISGVGFGANGAVINSGASQISALRQVTLAGDVTFGGTNRWDIRNTGGTANLSTSGQPYNITKVGTNQVSLVAVTSIDSALGDIDIQQGEFAIQTSTTQVGDPTKTITVHSNATLNFYQLSTPLNKNIDIQNGGNVFDEKGPSYISGGSTITLEGSAYFDVTNNGAPPSLNCSNVITGAGNLIVTGGGILTLSGTNTYTGSTLVTTGTLALVSSGSISNSALINVAAGATIDVGSHNGLKFTLNSGQMLSGNGTINGSLTVNSNAVVSPGNGGTGILTVSGSVFLNGTALMKLNKTARTNDVISTGTLMTYAGGILMLTNMSGTLTTTDTFKLFSAPAYGVSGSPMKPFPAIPALNLAWNISTLPLDGILRITSAPTTPPKFAAVAVIENNFVLSVTNGPAGYPCKILVSTNVALPLAQWTPVMTNTFDVNGNFSMTNSPGVNAQKFFVIQVP